MKERTGLSTGNLSELENDIFAPSSNTLLAFKRVFNISIDWLLTGEEPMILSINEVSNQYISDEEREFIKYYKILDGEKKRDIRGFIHVLTKFFNRIIDCHGFTLCFLT